MRDPETSKWPTDARPVRRSPTPALTRSGDAGSHRSPGSLPAWGESRGRWPFFSEQRPERIRDHPSRPGSPVEGDDTTMRHPNRGLLRPFVEVFARSGIGHLGPIGRNPRRRRGEEQQDFERFRLDRVEQMVQALDLGLVNQVELRVGLIGDPPIRQDARPVDQPTDRTELIACPDNRLADRGFIPHIDGTIDDRRADRGNAIEVSGRTSRRAMIWRTCSPMACGERKRSGRDSKARFNATSS